MGGEGEGEGGMWRGAGRGEEGWGVRRGAGGYGEGERDREAHIGFHPLSIDGYEEARTLIRAQLALALTFLRRTRVRPAGVRVQGSGSGFRWDGCGFGV